MRRRVRSGQELERPAESPRLEFLRLVQSSPYRGMQLQRWPASHRSARVSLSAEQRVRASRIQSQLSLTGACTRGHAIDAGSQNGARQHAGIKRPLNQDSIDRPRCACGCSGLWKSARSDARNGEAGSRVSEDICGSAQCSKATVLLCKCPFPRPRAMAVFPSDVWSCTSTKLFTTSAKLLLLQPPVASRTSSRNSARLYRPRGSIAPNGLASTYPNRFHPPSRPMGSAWVYRPLAGLCDLK